MPPISVWAVSAWLIIALIVETASLAFVFIKPPAFLHGEYLSVAACILFGGIGGLAYCLRGVYINASVYKRWDTCWLPRYLLRPVVSFVFGGISYLFVKSGLLLLGSEESTASTPLGILTLAFIAGLNVDRFVAKIEEIGSTAWGVEPSRTSKNSSQSQTTQN
ncbi:hypothetical protein [Burkholderia multivorans]|uniref:hypothetical protein n=1 Tax=Burkholderia multivorans TaxID=87883 RepID=UPI0013DF1D2F|nr:hypothetical protein [Burkholderia multivorans]MBU9618966.1 hypothetical protein [Burkholderia multivorans]NGM76428.1 hypothetical protein [Burkholderia multivorans]